jgi:hypothetical protein
MRKFRGKLAVATGVVLALTIGGIAFAYWTQGGTGTGSATAGSTSAITVHQTSTATGLYPGATPVALSGDFTNPNSGPVTISSITAAVHAFSVQANLSKPACTEADFTIGGSSSTNVVPAGTHVGAWSGLTVALNAGSGNQDNCKGVSITIDYTASA